MLKAIAVGLALSMMLVASCSSSEPESNSFSCDTAKSKCPKDPPPSASDVAQCNKYVGDAHCGSVYITLLLCLSEHQTCAADGTTDQDATAHQCTSQVDAAEKCAGADAGGGG